MDEQARPRCAGGGPTAGPSTWPKRNKSCRVRRILVVDDSAAIREILSRILAMLGFEVGLAATGREGIARFSERIYDLVLTDLRMPDMDGWALADHVKARSPRTPVVLITGESEETLAAAPSSRAVDLALRKPFQLQEIEHAIETLLH